MYLYQRDTREIDVELVPMEAETKVGALAATMTAQVYSDHLHLCGDPT